MLKRTDFIKMIECTSIKGNKVLVPKEKLRFRPSVYAIIINEGKILMLNTRSNGKLFFPGGGVELGENLAEALKREVKEETGLEIEIGSFLHFKEQFFYWDPGDEAYQMFNFVYICKPLSFILLNDNEVDDIESEKPRWIDIAELKAMTDKIELVEQVIQLI